MTYTIANVFAFHKDAIASYQEPTLIQDVVYLGVYTDDDELPSTGPNTRSSKRDRNQSSEEEKPDDDGGSDSSDIITSMTRKGKGKMVPEAPKVVKEMGKPVLKRQKSTNIPASQTPNEVATSRGGNASGGPSSGGTMPAPQEPSEVATSRGVISREDSSSGDSSSGGTSRGDPSHGRTSRGG